MDPKLGPARKTAGIRNLPKIERKQTIAGLNQVKLSSDIKGKKHCLPLFLCAAYCPKKFQISN
jgi:hypothetical protein